MSLNHVKGSYYLDNAFFNTESCSNLLDNVTLQCCKIYFSMPFFNKMMPHFTTVYHHHSHWMEKFQIGGR